MQKKVFKIMIVFVLSTAPFFYSWGQPVRYAQQVADSLFEEKKYTQSFDLYDSIYQAGYSSASMLLKMAYIREGLGDYTMAMYYLYEYYTLTSDELALEKMESLASARNLVGYDYSDNDYFLSVYHEYHNQILQGLGALAIIFLLGVLYQRFVKKRRPVGNFIFMTTFSVLFLAVLHMGMGFTEGIVVHPNTYVMDAPSASANVVDILQSGHKIPIEGKKDVWYKTTWNDAEVFIKQKNMLPLNTW